MKSKETYLGSVRDVNGTTISISVSKDSLTGFIYIKGQGYRVGQIGSFIRIPIGFKNLFGVISQVGSSAVSESQMNDQPNGDQWMTVQILGEGERNGGFQRGITQYPTIGDEVHLVSESELKTIYGQPDKPYFVKLGNISNAESIPALLDVNKLVTRHSAIVGTTGSGKSTTVASIVNALSDTSRYPSSRVLMLDIHGEYGAAFKDSANTYKINSDARAGSLEKKLHIPFWALNFDELCAISFGEFNNEKDRNIVMEEIHKRKADSLVKYPRKGITLDTLNTDSPIPFSIHELWLDLYIKTFGTYYKNLGGRPADNIAYETDSAGTLLKGDAPNGIPPVFKNVKNEADDPEKIHYLPESNKYNFGKQLTLLGSKLRIPRYSFIFNAGEWNPDFEGKIDKDLDELLFNWIGSNKTITILDLSGVPSDILHTVIGILLRILYEALFWSRFLSQGGKHRPLLLVMEEAHLYLNDAKENMASATVQRIVKENQKLSK